MLQVDHLDVQREIIYSCRNPQGKVKVHPTIHEKHYSGLTNKTEKANPKAGAGNEIRTRDTKLGKLVLYQLSYARFPKI